jgi:hypothetical protein
LFRIFSCRELFLRFSYIHPAVRTVELVYTSVADPDPGSGIGYLFDPWIRYGRKSAWGSGDLGWTTRIIFFRA